MPFIDISIVILTLFRLISIRVLLTRSGSILQITGNENNVPFENFFQFSWSFKVHYDSCNPCDVSR